jgi:predicted ATPase with chaperone activity
MNAPSTIPAADAPVIEGPSAPPVPETVADTGLLPETIADLLLKMLYVQGARSGQQLVEAICLPFPILDDLLLKLQHERMIEVKRTVGAGRGGYIFEISAAGADAARDAMAANQYVGPAPVPIFQYNAWIERQSVRHLHVSRERLAEAFAELVLPDTVLDTLGPAVNSARSLFIFGDSGNGKTHIAETIAGIFGQTFFLPHAVDVHGQIMVVYDPVYHQVDEEPEARIAGDPDWLRRVPEYDRRFVRVRRPVVVTGGELTLEQLDLQYDTNTKMYQAPFQVKANGGVLIVDDFGRQRVPPRDLLNRWIVPLEKRMDYLTLHTGSKFPVPFDCLLIFATNLDPSALVEEAFLRRIHYKIRMHSPERTQYEEIFRRCCAARGIPYRPEAVAQLYRDYYEARSIRPRGCHPRDITDHVCDIARFQLIEPELTPEILDSACRTYFLDA